MNTGAEGGAEPPILVFDKELMETMTKGEQLPNFFTRSQTVASLYLGYFIKMFTVWKGFRKYKCVFVTKMAAT